jgi:siderophore synthetase component
LLTIQELEHEEHAVYTLLEDKYPDLTDDFLRKVPTARFEIMERLINALLRENIMRKGIVIEETNKNIIKLTLLDSTIFIPIIRKYSYHRYKLINNVVYTNKQGHQSKIIHPLDLLKLLLDNDKAQGSIYPNLDLFYKELANSVANMALAMVFEAKRKQMYTQMCQENNWTSTIELVNGLAREDASFDKVTFFEQWCVTGHHQHPSTKAKIGLTPQNVIRYSPEFGNVTSLVFVALHKYVAFYKIEENKQPNQIWYNDYPELVEPFVATCLRNGKDVEDYILLPVHPWQWEHIIRKMYSNEIEHGHLFSIPHFSIPTRPTLSVRTMSPIGREKKYHIKLPLHVQMTSAVRLISPNAVQNGPELTRLLRQILKVENKFDGKLDIMGEHIGIRFKSNMVDEMDYDNKSKNLAVLLRDNPLSLLHVDETAIVGCALLNSSPVSDKSLLLEIMDNFDNKHDSHTLEDNILLFFKKYIDVLLNSTIPLMTRYGIGLEGHFQNSLIVFQDNEPRRIIIRDLGGLRIDRKRLEKWGYFGEFHPDSAIIGMDHQEMHNKIIHTVFQNHIGELTLHLSNHFKLDESLLWKIVRDDCYKVFAKLKEDMDLKDEVDLDMAAIFAPVVKTKALTVMRLCNNVTNYSYTSVPNPLYDKSTQ